jgi:signal transduction histidine kinase
LISAIARHFFITQSTGAKMPDDGPAGSFSPWEVLRDIGLGIAIFDPNERLLDSNAGFHALYGGMVDVIKPGISLAALLDTLATRNQINAGASAGWVNAALSSLRGMIPIQHDLLSGRSYEIAPHVVPAGIALTVQDITTLKRGDAALREARDIADRANQSKSRFLRAASHDLRQPLATLKILIYTCQGNLDELARPETLRAMDVSVSVIEDLLGALLNIGQLDGGGIVAHVDSVPIAAILDRLFIQFKHQAEQKGLKLTVVPSSLVASADRILLERILSNLVSNAIRYTDVGRILVGCKRGRDTIQIMVADTGRGILPEHQSRIFDEFYRVVDRPELGQKGLGLGLNIAKRFSELIGATISLRSTPGRGSCFCIRVPLGEVWRASVAETAVSELVAGQFAGLEVLLVEDDLLLRDALSKLLQRWGILVTASIDPEEAVEAFRALGTKPDLAITDYRLPGGLRGTEVCTLFRKNFGADLPCIVVTGDTETQPLGEITAAGLRYLIKPVNPPQLRALMHHLLYEPDLPDPI